MGDQHPVGTRLSVHRAHLKTGAARRQTAAQGRRVLLPHPGRRRIPRSGEVAGLNVGKDGDWYLGGKSSPNSSSYGPSASAAAKPAGDGRVVRDSGWRALDERCKRLRFPKGETSQSPGSRSAPWVARTLSCINSKGVASNPRPLTSGRVERLRPRRARSNSPGRPSAARESWVSDAHKTRRPFKGCSGINLTGSGGGLVRCRLPNHPDKDHVASSL
jgi:hypothetical protein